MLIMGAAMFGMFYFLTFFVQGVLGYSALKSGFAFLPFCAVIIVGSGLISQVLPRTGPKVLIATGTVLATTALFLFSTVSADTGYATHLLPTMILMASGMACIFVPLTTAAVSRVPHTDAGLASALLNVGQQVGGAIGLSVLATVAATASRHAVRDESGKLSAGSLQHFGELATSAQNGTTPSAGAVHDSVAVHAYNVVQAHASGMGFLTGAIFGLVAIVVAAVVINVKKGDMVEHSPAAAG
jgi:hypothetical protein